MHQHVMPLIHFVRTILGKNVLRPCGLLFYLRNTVKRICKGQEKTKSLKKLYDKGGKIYTEWNKKLGRE